MDVVKEIVEAFYSKAISDVIIGYHFRKIQEQEAAGDVLNPPLSFFQTHIPRIVSFWKFQLYGEKPAGPFNLIATHVPLRIRKGELDRWLTLFHQTLDEFEDSDLILKWREKLSFFAERFRESDRIFT